MLAGVLIRVGHGGRGRSGRGAVSIHRRRRDNNNENSSRSDAGRGLALLPSFAQAEFFRRRQGRASNCAISISIATITPARRQPVLFEEWAQGFLLRYESGFTEGLFRPGHRCAGPAGRQAGLPRQSDPVGLLPYSDEPPARAHDYSSLGLTACFTGLAL